MPLPVRRMQTVHRMQCSRRFRFGAWRKVQHRCRQTARRGSWKGSDCWTLRRFRTYSTLENWALLESRCTLEYLATPRQKNYSCDKKQSLSNVRDGAQNVCTQMLPTQCNRRSTIHAIYKTNPFLIVRGGNVSLLRHALRQYLVETVLGWDSNLLRQRFFVWGRDTSSKGGLADVSRKRQDDTRAFRHATSGLLFDINLDWRTQNPEKKHQRARFAQWINIRCTVRGPSLEGGCRLCRDPARDTKPKKKHMTRFP